MKSRKMRELCFENKLQIHSLLIEFIEKITYKTIDFYGKTDWNITEQQFIKWIERFKSGNPINFMTKDEAKSFVAVIMRSI